MKVLSEKVAIVTGSSRGVGAEIAKVFAQQGATICVNYFKSEDKARKVVETIEKKGGKAFAYYADVTNTGEVDKLVAEVIKQHNKIDVVVNNALPNYKFDPFAPYTSIETVTWENFLQQIDGAIKGVFNVIRAVLPFMKERKFGKIINISTNLVYNPVVTYYDYTTAKAGLVGLTRNLASELGKHGICVNLVAGGLLKATDASSVTSKEVFELVASQTPLRNVVTVEQFAKSLIFFASDWSNAVTGQTIAVDGGLTMP